jgi:hypothetical protein
LRSKRHCTKANVSDDQGLIEMLSDNIDYFRSKAVNIPKITILLDNGYHPEKLEQQLKKVYPQIMSKIRFKLSPKPSKEQSKGRKNWLRSCPSQMGHRKNQFLDGKM